MALAQRAQVALMGLFQGTPPPPIHHSVLMALFFPDLSFNNIEAIEGLDTLVNLEDLSLFNNRISKIDSLDALVKLQVLSLGNNHIGNMMNVSWEGRGWGWPCRDGELLGAVWLGQWQAQPFPIDLPLFLEKPETQMRFDNFGITCLNPERPSVGAS